MTLRKVYEAASEVFLADARVRAMPHFEGDGSYMETSSHRLFEGDDMPMDYTSASLHSLGNDVVAFLPSGDSFLDGPTRIVWSNDGSCTEFFEFEDGEERTLNGHERLRYEAHRAPIAAEMKTMDERVEAARDFLCAEGSRLAKASDAQATAGRHIIAQELREMMRNADVLSVQLHYANKDQDREQLEKLLAVVEGMKAPKVAA